MKKSILLIFLGICITQFELTAQFNQIENIAKEAILNKHNTNFGADFNTSSMLTKDLYQTKHNRVHHVYLNQSYNGLEVINAVANVNVLESSHVLSAHSSFINPKKFSNVITEPQIDLNQACAAVAAEFDIAFEGLESIELDENTAEQKHVLRASSMSNEDITARLVYEFSEKSHLKLCWEIVFVKKDDGFFWVARIDAESGAFVSKLSWTIECGHLFANGHSVQEHAEHNCKNHNTEKISVNPTIVNTYNVYAMPVESPIHGGRTVESQPWSLAPNASPFGWHDDDGADGAEYTNTRGNNVWASEDRDANNVFGYAPDGGASLDFDFPIDLNDDPIDYEDVAITNLFYWNNLIHDVMYQYGFDEVSGNFQANNYGNGGVAGDYVNADAQDGSGTNNANFGTPPDGSNPRMQMYEWTISGGNLFLDVNSPSNIAGSYTAGAANFGPSSGTYTGDLVYADPNEACDPINNGAELSGNIALVDRGNCNFTVKVANAQAEGAIAVVVCNNVAGSPITMGGTDSSITIPSVMISQADCDLIKVELANTVNVTFNLDVGSPPNRDSDLDNGIIVHEYGHGISIRLTGGPNSSGCLNGSEQMGEGWSDYFGLMMTMKDGDQGTDIRGIGTYVLGQATDGSGIRQYPYTTDMSINPHTYADVSGVAVPHGVGSIWCAMLWDMTWALIDEHGFDADLYNGTGGNNIALQLVMDGLKLQPCNPGFVDGRDAILEADLVNNGGANQCIIWEAFAARGLGDGADQGASSSVSDGTEDFELPALCLSGMQVDKTGPVSATLGETISYDLSVLSFGTLNNVTLMDTLPPSTILVGNNTCGSFSGNILNQNIGTLNPNDSYDCTYDLQLAGTGPSSVINFEDDNESGDGNYTVTTQTGSEPWTLGMANPNQGSFAWFIPNITEENIHFLELTPVTVANGDILSVWHSYNTEANWDGGLFQISTDGTTWTDLGPLMVENGYNSTIEGAGVAPLAGNPAFSGNSGGYIETRVDLDSYAGQTVNIRFLFASDTFVAEEGWYIDEVSILQPVYAQNVLCVSNDNGDVLCDTIETLVLPSENVPDLSSVITFLPTSADGITTMAWTARFQELDNQPTSGTITAILPKDGRLNFTYDPSLTVIGPFGLNNADWSYDGSNASFHIWTSNVSIDALGISSFGFEGVYDPQGTSGQTTFTITLLSGSGGELDGTNNADAETLNYQSSN